jgi:hypothetical protein
MYAASETVCWVLFDSRRGQRAPAVSPVRPKLADQLHALLSRDAEYRGHSRAVRRLQSALRASVSARAWQRYLTLEEEEAARGAHALERVARWAFARGRRAATSRR